MSADLCCVFCCIAHPQRPKTEKGKISHPGLLKVRRNADGSLDVLPRGPDEVGDAASNELKVVYDNGPVPGFVWDDFDTVRARVKEQWKKCPKVHDVVSPELKERIAEWIRKFDVVYLAMMQQIEEEAAAAVAKIAPSASPDALPLSPAAAAGAGAEPTAAQ